MFNEEQQLKKILREAIHGDLKKDYIASGFFTPQQKEKVSQIEKALDELEVNYHSPRNSSTDFTKLGIGVKVHVLEQIFKRNVEEIDNAGNVWIVADHTRDIGTMWELGYAAGKKKDIKFVCDSEEETTMFELIVKNLQAIGVNSNEVAKEFINRLVTKDNIIKFDITKAVTGLSMTQLNLPSLIDIKDVNNNCNYFFCVDNRPFQLFVLMGYMYSQNVDYYTTSFKGFGSNVMISASSKGHINLNGITDSRYDKKID